jgi:lipopolysaccharide/colanic/teichoic acid biosynthesis glycosyltransferase
MMSRFWNFANPIRHVRRVHTLRRIHDPDMLHYIIERERARADRMGQWFSLVLLEIDGRSGADPAVRKLVRVFTRRVRAVDEVGWLNDRCLAAVLPGTPSEGARKLADDIGAAVAAEIPGEPFYRCTFWSYPTADIVSEGLREEFRRRERRREASPFSGRREKIPRVEPASGESARALEKIIGRPFPLWKRALDVAGALLSLILLSPVFAAVALLIKIVSPGPVFFRQERIGYMGKPFTFWKFRTMHAGNDPAQHQRYVSELIKGDRPMVKLDDGRDPRIIPFGQILRKLCLDELPQLFNVLGGTMSLVGPRPCLPYEAREYLLWYTRRFDILPGMTGLWQVSGKNRTTFKEMIRLDIRYARKATPWMDIGILLRTVPAIVSQTAEGAPKAENA